MDAQELIEGLLNDGLIEAADALELNELTFEEVEDTDVQLRAERRMNG